MRRETLENFNGLFHPVFGRHRRVSPGAAAQRYVLQRGRNRDLYLSFVNFSFFGEEGDVFGNVLAVLLGLADDSARRANPGRAHQGAGERSLPRAGGYASHPDKTVRCGVPTWRAIDRISSGSTTTEAYGRWWADSGYRHSWRRAVSSRQAWNW